MFIALTKFPGGQLGEARNSSGRLSSTITAMNACIQNEFQLQNRSCLGGDKNVRISSYQDPPRGVQWTTPHYL